VCNELGTTLLKGNRTGRPAGAFLRVLKVRRFRDSPRENWEEGGQSGCFFSQVEGNFKSGGKRSVEKRKRSSHEDWESGRGAFESIGKGE